MSAENTRRWMIRNIPSIMKQQLISVLIVFFILKLLSYYCRYIRYFITGGTFYRSVICRVLSMFTCVQFNCVQSLIILYPNKVDFSSVNLWYFSHNERNIINSLIAQDTLSEVQAEPFQTALRDVRLNIQALRSSNDRLSALFRKHIA